MPDLDPRCIAAEVALDLVSDLWCAEGERSVLAAEGDEEETRRYSRERN